MGDRGIPKTWRHMNGYSSHAYMWVNAKGQRFWVKYHFKTDQWIDFLTQKEAAIGSPVRTGTTIPATFTTRSNAETTRVGHCICRSCHSTMPRATDSTRSI
jgi:Catalase